MKRFPCKECTARTLGCHGTCEEYKTAKEVFDRGKAERYLIGALAEMEMASMRRNRCKWYDRKWQ